MADSILEGKIGEAGSGDRTLPAMNNEAAGRIEHPFSSGESKVGHPTRNPPKRPCSHARAGFCVSRAARVLVFALYRRHAGSRLSAEDLARRTERLASARRADARIPHVASRTSAPSQAIHDLGGCAAGGRLTGQTALALQAGGTGAGAGQGTAAAVGDGSLTGVRHTG